MKLPRKMELVTESFESQPSAPGVSRSKQMGLATGLLIMDKENIPRPSVMLWALLALIAVVLALAYYLGKASGEIQGLEKGRQDAQIERIAEDLKQLKQNSDTEERQRRNIRLAQELTTSTNTEQNNASTKPGNLQSNSR